MEKKYCCETMQRAIQEWGGVWWDKEKKSWRMMREYRDGYSYDKEITGCPWCGEALSPPESEEK